MAGAGATGGVSASSSSGAASVAAAAPSAGGAGGGGVGAPSSAGTPAAPACAVATAAPSGAAATAASEPSDAGSSWPSDGAGAGAASVSAAAAAVPCSCSVTGAAVAACRQQQPDLGRRTTSRMHPHSLRCLVSCRALTNSAGRRSSGGAQDRAPCRAFAPNPRPGPAGLPLQACATPVLPACICCPVQRSPRPGGRKRCVTGARQAPLVAQQLQAG